MKSEFTKKWNPSDSRRSDAIMEHGADYYGIIIPQSVYCEPRQAMICCSFSD